MLCVGCQFANCQSCLAGWVAMDHGWMGCHGLVLATRNAQFLDLTYTCVLRVRCEMWVRQSTTPTPLTTSWVVGFGVRPAQCMRLRLGADYQPKQQSTARTNRMGKSMQFSRNECCALPVQQLGRPKAVLTPTSSKPNQPVPQTKSKPTRACYVRP